MSGIVVINKKGVEVICWVMQVNTSRNYFFLQSLRYKVGTL